MNESLVVILKRMCEVVGCDYDTIDFKSNDWYTTYTWSEEQQNEFIDWMVDYLKKSSTARKDMSILSSSKKELQRFSQFFVSMYGWKDVTLIEKDR